jgi:type IV pilus assembly protein PilA
MSSTTYAIPPTSHALTSTIATPQSGFTLVELMIVVTIIGVLSSIAVPAYQNYIQKSEATAGVSSASALTTNIDLFIQENGKFPSTTNLEDIGANATMSSLGTLTITPDSDTPEQGTLIFEFNDSSSINEKKVQWRRNKKSGWQCVQNIAEHIKGCPKGTIG